MFLQARAGTIYGGSSEIQRNTIAEQILGLPREPRVPIAVTPQYGGAGASFIELAIALEEAGYALAGGPLFASSVLASTCLQQPGDARAMAEYLPGIASGQKIATLAVADDNGAWIRRPSTALRLAATVVTTCRPAPSPTSLTRTWQTSSWICTR